MENYNDCKKKYYDNGNIKSEAYYLNGKLHRIDGPAYIHYYNNYGNDIFKLSFYLNGNIHKTDGPAIILYYMGGEDIIETYYFLNGEQINVNSIKEFKQYKKKH